MNRYRLVSVFIVLIVLVVGGYQVIIPVWIHGKHSVKAMHDKGVPHEDKVDHEKEQKKQVVISMSAYVKACSRLSNVNGVKSLSFKLASGVPMCDLVICVRDVDEFQIFYRKKIVRNIFRLIKISMTSEKNQLEAMISLSGADE